MSPLTTEIVKGVFTLAAVLLGSVVAMRVYFRQKEYELAKQRYLEQGVDVVASELEAALGIVSHNYARSLHLCKFFRDSGADFDIKELERGFLPLDSSKFRRIAHHRVSSLLQSQVLWDAFQHAMAYAATSNSVIVQEIPEAIRLLSRKPPDTIDRPKLSEDMVKHLKETHDSGFKYANLLRELHALALLLEAKPINLAGIAAFHQRAEAQAIVQRLAQEFPKRGSEADGSV